MSTYYEAGLIASLAVARGETLRVGLNDGEFDLAGRDLAVTWRDLAPGEAFQILGRVDLAGELHAVDWDEVQGLPSGYRPGRVTMSVDENVGSIPAIVRAWERWNGWAVPLFTREALIAGADVLRAIFPDDMVREDIHEGIRLTFDADGFPSLTDLAYTEGGEYYEPGCDPEQIRPVEIDGVTYYDVGAGGFCWEDALDVEHEHFYSREAADWLCKRCGVVTDACIASN